MELLIEEFEDVIFPSIDSGIDKIVSVIRGFAYWRVNFQEDAACPGSRAPQP